MMQPFAYAAIETEGSFYIECDFFAPSTGERFPLFVSAKPDGVAVHDNGFLTAGYGMDAQSMAGIQLVAKAFGFELVNGVVTANAQTEQEQLALFGNLLSLCFCIDSTLGGRA